MIVECEWIDDKKKIKKRCFALFCPFIFGDMVTRGKHQHRTLLTGAFLITVPDPPPG